MGGQMGGQIAKTNKISTSQKTNSKNYDARTKI